MGEKTEPPSDPSNICVIQVGGEFNKPLYSALEKQKYLEVSTKYPF